MGQIRTVICAIYLLTAMTVSAKCGYYRTYEDFIEGNLISLDTIFADAHGIGRQFWWGGNDYTLTTGNKDTDKKLKKEALILMKDDTLYVNCRKLRFEKTRFANGYAKTRRIGKRSLIFVNRTIGKKAQSDVIVSEMMFGAIGGALVGSQQIKQRVCYIVSNGSDEKGRTEVRMIDDALMEKMIYGHDDLYEEYYSEEKESKRNLATRVLPILAKAGLFELSEQEKMNDDTMLSEIPDTVEKKVDKNKELPSSTQCGYCCSYEELMGNQWKALDNIYSDINGQGRKLWFGNNDYRLTTENDSIDKVLKKEAFAIMKKDELYVNCRKLVRSNVRFKGGYARAWRSDNDEIIFVNEVIGKEAQLWQTSSNMLAGSGGNFTYSSNQIRHRVCYLISDGSNGKEYTEAILIDDALMDKLLEGHNDLYAEYYSEEQKSNRMLAKHVFPILMKAGVLAMQTRE